MAIRENTGEIRGSVEIDLQKLLLTYLRKWWIIVLCGVVAACLFLYYTAYHITPLYRADVTIYVNNIKSTQQLESISGSNLSAAQQLVNTYVNIIKSDRVLDKVSAQMDGKYSAASIRKVMTAAQVDDTEIFTIYVTHASPEEAANIANAIADVAPDEISSLVEGSSARIIDYAKVPTSRYSPSYERNTILGGVIGVVIAVVYLTIRYLLDVRLKDEDDLMQIFDLPVLGQIPSFVQAETKKKSSYGYDSGKTSRSTESGK